MARKETVPIDMNSEQKVILGIISKRQLTYLIAGGALLYFYVPKVFSLVGDPVIGVIFALISAIPTASAIGLLGFMKHHKYNLNFDQYFLLKFNYKKEIGVWRRGPSIEKTKVNLRKKKGGGK
ncbi:MULTISPECIES: PrgI family mobile element protein [Oceanobacillus]|uniref:PrgI family protein n=1 Tax=Oceanobacillus kimchii TaxID=746691 RepID=A0ABQ5TRB5_9BACI|nr:PrgI family protein [Oceanobacillus kimchii]GLO68308.1 hypothetical protein MACH08_40920 [Oceanobacillus kimchii]